MKKYVFFEKNEYSELVEISGICANSEDKKAFAEVDNDGVVISLIASQVETYVDDMCWCQS